MHSLFHIVPPSAPEDWLYNGEQVISRPPALLFTRLPPSL